MDFAAQDINNAGILEKQIRRPFPARDRKFLLDVAHNGSPC